MIEYTFIISFSLLALFFMWNKRRRRLIFLKHLKKENEQILKDDLEEFEKEQKKGIKYVNN